MLPSEYFGFILWISIIVLFVANLTLSIINFVKCKSLDYLVEDDPEIYLTLLSRMDFSDYGSTAYVEGMSNLGFTGKLMLDCYEGVCYYEYKYDCSYEECTGEGEDRKCKTIKKTCKDEKSETHRTCSNACRYSYCGSSHCPNKISKFTYSTSSCHRKEDDTYSALKNCYPDNMILIWNKKYYKRGNHSYIVKYKFKKAILADEMFLYIHIMFEQKNVRH